MTLVKWNPASLDHEINNLVKTFWGEAGPARSTRGWHPSVDIDGIRGPLRSPCGAARLEPR